MALCYVAMATPAVTLQSIGREVDQRGKKIKARNNDFQHILHNMHIVTPHPDSLCFRRMETEGC